MARAGLAEAFHPRVAEEMKRPAARATPVVAPEKVSAGRGMAQQEAGENQALTVVSPRGAEPLALAANRAEGHPGAGLLLSHGAFVRESMLRVCP